MASAGCHVTEDVLYVRGVEARDGPNTEIRNTAVQI